MIADAVIIGGGFAGLASASSLARAGAKVLLIEKKKFLGGRVYSIRDRRTGDWIDNGQHALMGCYHQTFDLLREWGTEDGVFLQPQIDILYRGEDGLRDRLRGRSLPGPLHLLGGLLSMDSLSRRDKWAAMRFGLRMKRRNAVKPGETVEQLCDRLAQSAALRERMWGAIALSALNEEIALADASLLQTVLQQAFFSSASDSRMGLPTISLQKLHGEASIDYLMQRQGRVLLNRRVERLEWKKNQIAAVVLSSGERLPCGACISAAPAPALAKIIQSSQLEDRIPVPELGASPILSVYLWYEHPLSDETFCCLEGCTFEWLFHRSNFMAPGEHKTHCVCLLASAARRLQHLSRDELIQAAVEDVHKTHPEHPRSNPAHASVFWAPQATFSATPDHVKKRLSAKTDLNRFFLAGDWIDTGLPATIEGAVISGNKAAALAMKK